MNIEKLKEFCGEDWLKVAGRIRGALKSDIDLLNTTNEMILSHSGKQLRPLLSILVAKACSKPESMLPEDCIRVAAAAELLHNATLLHDDVADESDCRRGTPTLNYLMGPSVSVLVGDYWLVSAINEIREAEHFGPRLISIFSDTLTHLAEGEMLQLQKARKCDTCEDDYLRIIFSKTASLFEASAVAAAISVNAAAGMEEAVKKYAVSLGLAFQIRDDIFDYSPSLHTGKAIGADVRERKITLPLICAMREATEQQTAIIMDKIARQSTDVAEAALDFVAKHNGVGSAQAQLAKRAELAKESLSPLPETKEKRHLLEIADYLCTRNS